MLKDFFVWVVGIAVGLMIALFVMRNYSAGAQEPVLSPRRDVAPRLGFLADGTGIVQVTVLSDRERLIIVRVGDTCQAVYENMVGRGYPRKAMITSWSVPCP